MKKSSLIFAAFVACSGSIVYGQDRAGTPQSTNYEQLKARANQLFDFGIENGGVASAVGGVARALGSSQKLEKLLPGHPPSRISDQVFNAYNKSGEFDDLANAGDIKAGDIIQQQVCNYYPDACPPEKKIPNPEELAAAVKDSQLICTPIGVDIERVRANVKLQFKNECSVGGKLTGGDGSRESVGYFIAQCNGWDGFTVVDSQPKLPSKTFGRIERDARGVPTYLGYAFLAPCRPANKNSVVDCMKNSFDLRCIFK